MKIKTISALALSASSAFALMAPGPYEHKTICLDTNTDKDGVIYAGSCDQSANNKSEKLTILANGCADGQVSLTDTKHKSEKKFHFNIPACLPPHVVQL